MKRIFVLIVVLAGAIYSKAAEVAYFNKSWDEIRAKARAEHKYIFIDCYTEWCGWCKVMDKETMTDPEVSALLNDKFVPVKMDMEHGEGQKIAMKYHVSGYPTFLFFSPEGGLVYQTMGYQKTNDFREQLENALNRKLQFAAPGYSSTLDIDFPEFYKNAFGESGKKKFPTAEQVIEFLDGQKDLFSEVSFAVMMRFGGGEKYSKFFVDNISKYSSLYGSGSVGERMGEVLHKRLKEAEGNKNEAQLNDVMVDADKYMGAHAEQIKVWFRMDYYKTTLNWPRYMDELDAFIEKNGLNGNMFNQECRDLCQKCDDKAMLARACGYMKKVVKGEPKYLFMDTYASLLFKEGNKKEAEVWANKAIEAGRKDGNDVSTTEALLKKIKG